MLLVRNAGGGAYEVSASARVPEPLAAAYAMHFDASRFRDIRRYDVELVTVPGRRHVEYVTGCWPFRRRVCLDLSHAMRGPVAFVHFRSSPDSDVVTHGTWSLLSEGPGATSVRLTSTVHAPGLPGVRGLVAARVRRALEDMGADMTAPSVAQA